MKILFILGTILGGGSCLDLLCFHSKSMFEEESSNLPALAIVVVGLNK